MATPISDNKSSKESSDIHNERKQLSIIHEEDNSMHFIDSDNENKI